MTLIFSFMVLCISIPVIRADSSNPNLLCTEGIHKIFVTKNGMEYVHKKDRKTSNHCTVVFILPEGAGFDLTCPELDIDGGPNCKDGKLSFEEKQVWGELGYVCGNKPNFNISKEGVKGTRLKLWSTYYTKGAKSGLGFRCSVKPIMDEPIMDEPDDCPVSKPKNFLDCNCGVKFDNAPSMRLDGLGNRQGYTGELAEPLEYPWVVTMIHSGAVLCGGTLVSDRHVLTTHACVEEGAANDTILMFQKNSNGEHINRTYTEAVTRLFSDDPIYILTLSEPVPIDVDGDGILPICLPPIDAANTYNEEEVELAGVAELPDSTIPMYPKKFNLKLENDYDWCYVSFICNYNQTTGNNMCETDLGGPLMRKIPSSNRYELIGVFAEEYGGCNDVGVEPSEFTILTIFNAWIQDYINNSGGKICKNQDPH